MALLAQVSTQKLITTVIQASSDVFIKDQFNTPGYLTTGFLTLATSSTTDTYTFTNNPTVTGSVSTLGLAYFNGESLQTGSLYVSSLYLGSLDGTVKGELTIDNTASTLLWNGTSLTSGGGGLASIPSTLSTFQFFTSSAQISTGLFNIVSTLVLNASTVTTTQLTTSTMNTNSVILATNPSWILTSPIQTLAVSTNTTWADQGYMNTGIITTGILSTITANALTLGAGATWILTSPIQTAIVSSIFMFANSPFFDTVNIGSVSTMNSMEFSGLFSNYNNTVLAEISTGAGTQELLVFKGSSATDRVRVQTTGNFVVETGVSARLFNSNTTQTLSNATPAFIINSSSNVGIQTANPGATLDVAGTVRAVTLSSLALNISSINGGPVVSLSILDLQSTVEGLGSVGYISSASLTSSLISTTSGLQYEFQTTGFLSSPNLLSTTEGLQYEFQTAGFLSSPNLLSTVEGLGSSGYLSTGGQGYFSSVTINMLPQDAPPWDSNISIAGFDPEPNPLALDVFGSTRILKNLYVGSTTTVIGTGAIVTPAMNTTSISAATTVISSIGFVNPDSGEPIYLEMSNGKLIFDGSEIASALPSNLSTSAFFTSSITTSTLTTPQFQTDVNSLSVRYPFRDTSTVFFNVPSSGYIGIGTSSATNLLEIKDWTDSNYTGSLISLQTGQAGLAPSSSNYYYHTATQVTYTVPANTFRIELHMWGGGGAGGQNGGLGGTGGGGAYVRGFLDVTPGQQFYMRVAGEGGTSNGVGGFGGGGLGNNNNGGGNGGGASWFQTAPGSNIIAIAGGGGGGGGFSSTYNGGAATWSGVGFRGGSLPQTQTTTPTSNAGGGGDTNAVSPANNGGDNTLGSSGTAGLGGNSAGGVSGGGGGGWVGGGGGGSTGGNHGPAGGGSSYVDGLFSASGSNADGAVSGGSNAIRAASALPSAGTGGTVFPRTGGTNGLIAIVEYTPASAKQVKMINLQTVLGATTSYFGSDGTLGLNTSNITNGFALDVNGPSLLRNMNVSTISTGLITNPLRLGTLSSLTSINFAGLTSTYSNTAIAEISTGAGTQELLLYKVSSSSDRVRVQTTGNFVVETGVSARLWPVTLSNTTPAFIINSSSNVGIQTSNPGATLDVVGTARAITFSTNNTYTGAFYMGIYFG